MFRSFSILLILLVQTFSLYSQTYLRITTFKLGKTRSYDVYINQAFEYRLKGDIFYKKKKIVAMSESTLVFENYEEIRLDELKSLRMHVNNHLIAPFHFVFMAGGIAFLPLNTLNNLIIGTSPAFNESAAYISAALIAGAVIIKQLGIRRVRLNKKTDLKVLTIDFENLNVINN